ncbi:MAG TPA: hypothetical protein DCQ31_15275 [Bacteroidales bacterium]|nr:hypothetical protein [Bacteroidales bacterium]
MLQVFLPKYTLFGFLLLFATFFSTEAQDIQYNADSQTNAGAPHLTRLTGNVRIRQNNLFIKCDEAVFDNSQNSFTARNNVKVKQDEMVISADELDYDGNRKLGKFRKNINVNSQDRILYTEFLDFNSGENSGYFYNGGKVIDEKSTLVASRGYYYSTNSSYLFLDKVFVDYPDYDIFTDTLRYQLNDNLVIMQGPTRIISDNNFIYCEKGKVNTKTDITEFSQNAYIINSRQRLAGTKIVYDRQTGVGKAYGNVSMRDSIQNVVITGDFAEYTEKPESSLIAGHALFVQGEKGDSLYLHADTLRSEYNDDGSYKLLLAYRKVKMFRTDMQSACDSLAYVFSDSTINMHHKPVLWSDINQITSEVIKIKMRDQKAETMTMVGESFIISQEDTVHYNQIKGRDMKAHFSQNQLSLIEVLSNAESIYFPKEETDIIGLNKSESERMKIYLTEGKVQKILFLAKPKILLSPLEDVKKEDFKFQKFVWLDTVRPYKPEEVFNWTVY